MKGCSRFSGIKLAHFVVALTNNWFLSLWFRYYCLTRLEEKLKIDMNNTNSLISWSFAFVFIFWPVKEFLMFCFNNFMSFETILKKLSIMENLSTTEKTRDIRNWKATEITFFKLHSNNLSTIAINTTYIALFPKKF